MLSIYITKIYIKYFLKGYNVNCIISFDCERELFVFHHYSSLITFLLLCNKYQKLFGFVSTILERNVENALACSRHFSRKVNRTEGDTQNRYTRNIVRDSRGRVLLFESLCAGKEERKGVAYYILALSRLGFTRWRWWNRGMEAGIKKRVTKEGPGKQRMSGVSWRGGASLHLPTNFMRLVNSRKKLTDRLIYELSNFII